MVTIGSNFMPWENARKCADILKICKGIITEKNIMRSIIKSTLTGMCMEVRRPQRCKAVGFIISPTDSPC